MEDLITTRCSRIRMNIKMNNPKASTLQRRRANFAIQAKKWAKKRKKEINLIIK